MTGEYAPFEGLCLVDTLGLADDDGKLALFAEENTERIARQRNAPITVIIGNPPYNTGQQDENDNNKNRKYKVIDQRVKETYVKDSKATLRAQVYDAYVKFWRWASDRLGTRDGVVVYVTNNGFLDGVAFDGMRKNLLQDFSHVYHINMKGNARTSSERRRQEGGNVFNDLVRVSVGITIAVRSSKHTDKKVFYTEVPDYWEAGQKLKWLADHVERNGRENSLNTVPWTTLIPDAKNNWRAIENADEFSGFIPMGSKAAKAAKGKSEPQALFQSYSRGTETTRDGVVYDYDVATLKKRILEFIEDYNSEVDRYKRSGNSVDVDKFVKYDRIDWSRDLKADLKRGRYAEFKDSKMRKAIYRPFSSRNLFFDKVLNQEIGQLNTYYPNPNSENICICLTDIGSEKPFMSLVVNFLPDLHLVGAGSSTKTFPFYVYDEDGTNRRENITDWALAQFRAHYADESISKWDIFYYVYALLHHPQYRQKYAAALKKELPRIPFVPNGSGELKVMRDARKASDESEVMSDEKKQKSSDSPSSDGEPLNSASDTHHSSPITQNFFAFAKIGRALADLHLNYETVKPYPLTETWAKGRPADYRVEKMKWAGKKPHPLAPSPLG